MILLITSCLLSFKKEDDNCVGNNRKTTRDIKQNDNRKTKRIKNKIQSDDI